MTNPPIYIFFHICCINNWHSVVTKLYEEIKKSGLYDKVDVIYCGVLGNPEQDNHPMFLDPKVKILFFIHYPNLFERPTLNCLFELSGKNDFYVLYIHSKGIQHDGKNPCVEDWVDYLTYFNIYKHEECISRLTDFDVVGVNLNSVDIMGTKRPHFSGNFWWSKSTYIRRLNPQIEDFYIGPELWVTSCETGMFSSLFSSESVNHYRDRFLPEEYVGKSLIFGNK
jgi:hypothetical protein